MIKSQVLSVYILLFSLFILSSCSPVNYRPLFRSKTDAISDTLKTIKVINPDPTGEVTYRIQAHDMLDVRNSTYQQIESTSGSGGGGGGGGGQNSGGGGGGSTGFRVEEDGNVTFPVIGKVYVLGLTRKQVLDKIQPLYADSLLRNSVLEVSVIGPRVTFLGEVSQQGTFYLDHDNVSLVEILGRAGGFTSKADPRTVKIVRGDKMHPEEIYVNLQNLGSLATSKILLQNKDVIYVMADKRYRTYDKSQSSISVITSVGAVITAGLLIYTTFFK